MSLALIAFIGATFFGSDSKPARYPELKPAWTITLHDADIGPNGGVGSAETNRSCGIARWDDGHVLVYFRSTRRNLVLRGQDVLPRGGWLFSVLVVRTRDGEVEQSAEIPADDLRSELAVVAGGIVISSYDRLFFYSKDFKLTEPGFSYRPLDAPIRSIRGLLGDEESLVVSEDQKKLVFLDSRGEQSHFFLFDGITLKEQRDWMVSGVDPWAVSIRQGKIIYGRLIVGGRIASTVSWTPVDEGTGGAEIASEASADILCRVPMTAEPASFLNNCGSIEVQSRRGNDVLYQPRGDQTSTAKLSPDSELAVVFNYRQTGGGVLDLTERTIDTRLLLFDLNSPHRVCQISLIPVPKGQLVFNFGNDSTLLVLDDGVLTAYRGPCPQ